MAKTGAILFRWGSTVRGRETLAVETFGQVVEYFEGLYKEGRITSHREYFSLNRDGGFCIIEGLIPELLKLVSEDDFVKWVVRSEAIVEDFRTEIFFGGTDATVQTMLELFTEELKELTLFT